MVNKEMMHPQFRYVHWRLHVKAIFPYTTVLLQLRTQLLKTPLGLDKACPQLVLRFDDISTPVDDWIEPSEKHVIRALNFADTLGPSASLLIHCHWE